MSDVDHLQRIRYQQELEQRLEESLRAQGPISEGFYANQHKDPGTAPVWDALGFPQGSIEQEQAAEQHQQQLLQQQMPVEPQLQEPEAEPLQQTHLWQQQRQEWQWQQHQGEQLQQQQQQQPQQQQHPQEQQHQEGQEQLEQQPQWVQPLQSDWLQQWELQVHQLGNVPLGTAPQQEEAELPSSQTTGAAQEVRISREAAGVHQPSGLVMGNADIAGGGLDPLSAMGQHVYPPQEHLQERQEGPALPQILPDPSFNYLSPGNGTASLDLARDALEHLQHALHGQIPPQQQSTPLEGKGRPLGPLERDVVELSSSSESERGAVANGGEGEGGEEGVDSHTAAKRRRVVQPSAAVLQGNEGTEEEEEEDVVCLSKAGRALQQQQQQPEFRVNGRVLPSTVGGRLKQLGPNRAALARQQGQPNRMVMNVTSNQQQQQQQVRKFLSPSLPPMHQQQGSQGSSPRKLLPLHQPPRPPNPASLPLPHGMPRPPLPPSPLDSSSRALVLARPLPPREPAQDYSHVLENLSLAGEVLPVEVEEGLLAVPLLPHQKLALGWMEQRERSLPAGGILADDQGLGKTVSTIALIVRCHHRRSQKQPGGQQEQRQQNGEVLNGPLDSAQGTGNWSKEGSPSPLPPIFVDMDDDVVVSRGFPEPSGIGEYKQGNRMGGAADADAKPQPRLSSMGDLAADSDGAASRAQGTGSRKKKPKLSGPQSKRLPGGTLVVCPTSVLWQWEKELRAKLGPEVKAELPVLVYHGSNRGRRTAEELAGAGVVLTTYAIVALDVPRSEGKASASSAAEEEREREREEWARMGWLEFMEAKERRRKEEEKKGKRGAASEGLRGPLACIHWHRVVLDEAQCIKNKGTQMAHSCWGLRAKRRWCLSGTPIQNSLDDLFSYFRFLRYTPFDDYAIFSKQLKEPNSGMQRLQAVLRAVMLRRTKTTKLEGNPIIQLPPRVVRLCAVEFSPEERYLYSHLEASTKAQFQDLARAGVLKKNYMSILVMLLRLRQACNDPRLLTYKSSQRPKAALQACSGTPGAGQARGGNSPSPSSNRVIGNSPSPVWGDASRLPLPSRLHLLQAWEGGGGLCGICQDVASESPAVSGCTHSFCLQCIAQHLEDREGPGCPVCGGALGAQGVYLVEELRGEGEGGRGGEEETGALQLLTSLPGGQVYMNGGQGIPPLPQGNGNSNGYQGMGGAGHARGRVSAKTRELLRLLLALPMVHYESPPGSPKAKEEPEGDADVPLSGSASAVSQSGDRKGSFHREKAIVFSQWSSMLDLLEGPLREAGLPFVRLDGSMSCVERDGAVTKFIHQPEITVILMSLKAASLGLNLVVARHVVLMDLWWNPSTEEQAIDRAHRIGQTCTVHVSRFAVKDTIEDRILELQEKKRTMVASAFGESKDGSTATRLTMDDLAFLFRSSIG